VIEVQEEFRNYSPLTESLKVISKFEEALKFTEQRDKMANNILFKNRFTLCFNLIGVFLFEVPVKSKEDADKMDGKKDIIVV
jgi:hypothetical protein